MKIVYRITETDLIHAFELVKSSRRAMLWVYLFMVIGNIALFFMGPSYLRVFFGAAVVLGSLCVCSTFMMHHRLRNIHRNDRRFQGDFVAEISDDGIHIVTANAESKLKWGLFLRAIESDDLFVLPEAEWLLQIFPKRAFAASDVAEFRSLIQKNGIPYATALKTTLPN